MGDMTDIPEFVDKLGAALAAHKEWGVIALITALLVLQEYLNRRERRKIQEESNKRIDQLNHEAWEREAQRREEEHKSDERMGELLEDRHDQVVELVNELRKVITENAVIMNDASGKVEDMADQLNNMDFRCQYRQDNRAAQPQTKEAPK